MRAPFKGAFFKFIKKGINEKHKFVFSFYI
jgi:hypothetical protein